VPSKLEVILMTVERVHTVEETYLSLPKKGVADFGGVAHRFVILGLGSFDWTKPDWFFEGRLPDHDLYELVPVADSDPAPTEPPAGGSSGTELTEMTELDLRASNPKCRPMDVLAQVTHPEQEIKRLRSALANLEPGWLERSYPSEPKIVRHGHFFQRKSRDGPKPDDLSSWDAVEWKPLSIQERLDRICDAQRGAGEEFGLPRYTPFMIGRFYLNNKDLEEIRPLLKPEPEKPNVGQIGRYRGIAVFPLSARPVVPSDEELPIAEYEGVFYGYYEMDHVFG
jgi:hypothetical protein